MVFISGNMVQGMAGDLYTGGRGAGEVGMIVDMALKERGWWVMRLYTGGRLPSLVALIW